MGNGRKVCPFHIDSLWLWPVGDVVLALHLHLAGTIHTITPLMILRATRTHHDVATATNGHPALGVAEKHQIRLKGRTHQLCIHSSQGVPNRDDKVMSPPEHVGARRCCPLSQEFLRTLDNHI